MAKKKFKKREMSPKEKQIIENFIENTKKLARNIEFLIFDFGENDQDFDSYPDLLKRLSNEVGDQQLEWLSQLLKDATDSDMRCPK